MLKNCRFFVATLIVLTVLLLPLAAQARWISVDPKASKYPSVSPYAYALNNPMKYTDPTGQWPERIHNQIIDKAFGNSLAPEQISVLKEASAYVDQDQSTANSFMHAMRGPGQSVEQAQQMMQDFVHNKTVDFVSCPGTEGLFALGEAMHALMDQTSPSHQGFQEWKGMKISNAVGGVVHYLKERNISDDQMAEIVKALQEFYEQAQEQQQNQTQEEDEQEADETN